MIFGCTFLTISYSLEWICSVSMCRIYYSSITISNNTISCGKSSESFIVITKIFKDLLGLFLFVLQVLNSPLLSFRFFDCTCCFVEYSLKMSNIYPQWFCSTSHEIEMYKILQLLKSCSFCSLIWPTSAFYIDKVWHTFLSENGFQILSIYIFYYHYVIILHSLSFHLNDVFANVKLKPSNFMLPCFKLFSYFALHFNKGLITMLSSHLYAGISSNVEIFEPYDSLVKI